MCAIEARSSFGSQCPTEKSEQEGLCKHIVASQVFGPEKDKMWSRSGDFFKLAANKVCEVSMADAP